MFCVHCFVCTVAAVKEVSLLEQDGHRHCELGNAREKGAGAAIHEQGIKLGKLNEDWAREHRGKAGKQLWRNSGPRLCFAGREVQLPQSHARRQDPVCDALCGSTSRLTKQAWLRRHRNLVSSHSAVHEASLVSACWAPAARTCILPTSACC